jgi:ubiquinone/menaquinone biosynthesis C-methylase UbiE
VNRVSQLLRLNARVGVLALRGRWLTGQEYGRGYDKVAPTYNSAWQCHLRPVTDNLLGRLPAGLTGTILDLGCGTGYAATWLARNNPQAKIIGVDISAGMLAQASRNALANVEFLQQDMLSYTRKLPASSVGAIVSAWALGYSQPAALFAECHRVLARGTFAFVVNYFDTLAPVFRAFQKCMLHYPERVRLAAWPRFPRNWRTLEHALTHAGFNIEWHEDGEAKVTPPHGPVLPWLRQTGILAGFDAMLDLSGPTETLLESELQKSGMELVHHYAAAVAIKP